MKSPSLRLFTIGLLALEFAFLSAHAEASPKKPAAPRIIESKNDPETLKSEGWQIPFPPYPPVARLRKEQGDITVEITTGVNGRATKVSVPKSKDHPILDSWTARWVYEKWSGPPNHWRTIHVTYLRPLG